MSTSTVIERQNLQHLLIEQIKAIIVSKNLKPGDRLGTEQELADRFGVSRSSIRETTKALAFAGVVSASPKRGIVISNFCMDRVADLLGLHWSVCNPSNEEIIKSRMVIEVGALRFAMERVQESQTDYERLLALGNRLMEDHGPAEFIEDEIAYHRYLVAASGIEPLLAFSDILHAFFRRFHGEVVARRHDPLVARHRDLVVLLREGRLEEAEVMHRGHLSTFLGLDGAHQEHTGCPG